MESKRMTAEGLADKWIGQLEKEYHEQSECKCKEMFVQIITEFGNQRFEDGKGVGHPDTVILGETQEEYQKRTHAKPKPETEKCLVDPKYTGSGLCDCHKPKDNVEKVFKIFIVVLAIPFVIIQLIAWKLKLL